FDFAHVPIAPREVLAHLATTTFVTKKENVVLLGPPGTGKTHLAIALGIKAAQSANPVLFDSATGWIDRLTKAHAAGELERELRRLKRYRLLIIDEVGYLPFDSAAAALFFQLVASRYETGSMIVTSNLPFGRWGETLGDDVVASATIDRLVHHAHVIGLEGDSYRTRAHRRATDQQPQNFMRHRSWPERLRMTAFQPAPVGRRGVVVRWPRSESGFHWPGRVVFRLGWSVSCWSGRCW